MPGALIHSELHVEGIDDQWTVINLLARHGITLQRDKWDLHNPEIKPAGDIGKLLAKAPEVVLAGTGKIVGFVLDADEGLPSRWQAVSDRMRAVGLDLPGSPPSDGFVADIRELATRVGIWIMPDNIRSGRLEDFLVELVANGDVLFDHARVATDTAVKLGAGFPSPHRQKAELHTWLAWQETPGLPYGAALSAHFFRHDTPTAVAFVDWFRRLYGIDETA